MADEVLNFGSDATKLLLDLQRVQEAFGNLGEQVLRVSSQIVNYNEKSEEISRTIDVLTQSGNKIRLFFQSEKESIDLVNTSIESSIRVHKEFEQVLNQTKKTLSDLGKEAGGSFIKNAELFGLKEQVQNQKELNRALQNRIKLTAEIQKLEEKKRLRNVGDQVKDNILQGLNFQSGAVGTNKVFEQLNVLGKLATSGLITKDRIEEIFKSVRSGVSNFSVLSEAELKAYTASEKLFAALSKINAKARDGLIDKNTFVSLKDLERQAKQVASALEKAGNSSFISLDSLRNNAARVAKTVIKEQTAAAQLRGELLGHADISNATAYQHINLLRASIQATAGVERGLVSPDRLRELFASVKSGAADFGTLTKAETQAVIGLKQLEYGVRNLGPPSVHFLLTWQNISRIFQVQVLHQIFGGLISSLHESVNQATQLYVKISEIQTISQRAQRSTEDWSVSLRALSDAYAIPVIDSADAAYEALSNQVVNSATAFRFLEKAAVFSKTAVASMKDSVNLLSSVLNAYNLSVSETDRISAALFKTIEVGRVRASEMANSLGSTAQLAKQAGLSLEEYLASISTLTIKGIQFDAANTLVRNVLLKLIKPTEEMTTLFREWGVTSGEAAINTFGFVGILQKLSQELEKSGVSRLAESFQDLRAIQGAVGLSGGDFKETYIKGFEAIGGTVNGATKALQEFKRASEITLNSPGFKFQQELNKAQNALNFNFGTRLVKEINDITQAFGGLSKTLEGVADFAIGVVRAVEPTIVILGSISKALSSLGDVATFAGGAFGSLTLSLATTSAIAHRTAIFNTMKFWLTGLRTEAVATSAAMAAVGTAAAGSKAAGLAGAALTLSGPFALGTGLVIGSAILSGIYAMYRKQQDIILSIEGETKLRLEQSYKLQAEYREKLLAQQAVVFRKFQDERYSSLNKQTQATVSAFNEIIDAIFVKEDYIKSRLGDTPILQKILLGDKKSINTSAELEEAFGSYVKDIRSKVEESLNESLRIKVDFDKQHFKNSLEGLTDTQVFDRLVTKVAELRQQAQNLFDLGQFAEARKTFQEINSIIDDLSNKKLDIFKEIERSLKQSKDYARDLKKSFFEREFDRKIGGLPEAQQIQALVKRGQDARKEAQAAFKGGDIEEARRNYELADKFLDKAVDKNNALRKKKKGGTGVGPVNEELFDIYKERLSIEKLYSEQQKQKQTNESGGLKTKLDDLRGSVADQQLNVEAKIREQLDAQLNIRKQLYDLQKKFFESSNSINAEKAKLLTDNENAQKRLSEQADIEKGFGGSLIAQVDKLLAGTANTIFGKNQFARTINHRSGALIKEGFSPEDREALLKARQDYEFYTKTDTSQLDKRQHFQQFSNEVEKFTNKVREGTPKGSDLAREVIGDQSAAELLDRISKTQSNYKENLSELVKTQKTYNDIQKQGFGEASEATRTNISNIEIINKELTVTIEKLKEANKLSKEFNITLPEALKVPAFQGSATQGSIPQGFARGGILGGPIATGPGDNQLIFARTGEFIVNAQSARRFHSQLVAINSGIQPRGYANGGSVTNVGDINVSFTGNAQVDSNLREFSNQLRRGIRRGTIRIN